MDHRVTNWLTIAACQELIKTKEIDPKTIVLTSLPFGRPEPQPTPYNFAKFEVHLSGQSAALKQEIAWFYQTQYGNQAEAEIKTLAELPRSENYLQITDWQEHDGWNASKN